MPEVNSVFLCFKINKKYLKFTVTLSHPLQFHILGRNFFIKYGVCT